MKFTEFPGAYERQLKRKYNHPTLFNISQQTINADLIVAARKRDSDELEDFMESFRKVVERAVSLKPNEQSDTILKLKEELDQHYEHCCSLQGDMDKIKTALKTLINAIMSAVRSGAGNDIVAQQKLDEEDTAREEHFRLQEIAFISDMMREEKSIPEDEFALSLLTEPMNVVTETIELFQPQELAGLVTDIHDKFSGLSDDAIQAYHDKVEAISKKLAQLADESSRN